MYMCHSTDRITRGSRIVEGELKEKCYLEPCRKGSIHNRWQWDKRAAQKNKHINQLLPAIKNQYFGARLKK
jgi:hypothetical protein